MELPTSQRTETTRILPQCLLLVLVRAFPMPADFRVSADAEIELKVGGSSRILVQLAVQFFCVFTSFLVWFANFHEPKCLCPDSVWLVFDVTGCN